MNHPEIYLVGGAVRDAVLGLPVTDRDWVVVGADPEYMRNQGYRPVGKDFPVFIDSVSGEEYALARTERKVARGYQGFEFNASPVVTLEQDLARRDITINAMAQDADGSLIDPFNGQRDLQAGVIRHVSEAFVEDPVRVLRVARFAARFNFTVADETQVLMKNMVDNGEINALVAERVWLELHKALLTDQPHVFFEVLRGCDALAKILPEINNLFGIPQTASYHPEIDTGVHTLMALQQAALLSDDPLVRFATLVHDLGKAATPPEVLPSHKGHEKAGLPIIKRLCERLRVPNKYRSLALAVAEYHLHMHKMRELKPATVLRVLEKTRCVNDRHRAQQIAMACIADAKGRRGFEQSEYPQAHLFLDYQQAADSVDAEQISDGLEGGRAIQRAVHNARVAAIGKIKRELQITTE